MSVFFKKNRRYVLEQYQVVRKLSKKVRKFLIFLPPSVMLSSSIINIPHQSGSFVTSKCTWTHHYHPKFTRRFTLGVLPFIRLDKCLMTDIHYIIIQNSSLPPTFSVSFLFIPPYPNPWKSLMILLST